MREREREKKERKKEMRIGWCQSGSQEAGRRRYLVELLLWGE
jgi:hypothetical protein